MDLNKRPFLNYKQLFYLSIGAFGLQIATTLVMNNTSVLFKFLGATDQQVSLLWLIAPLTGLIIQPILGQLSDLTEIKYGKRIPYILGGTLVTCVALLVLAFSENLTLTVCLILILSCSINASSESMRALVGDITPKKQKSSAFAWQAIFSGVGAIIASLIPWFLSKLDFLSQIDNTKIPITLKILMFFAAYVIIHSIWIMIKNIKEKNFVETNQDIQNNTSFFTLFLQIWQKLFDNLKNIPEVIRKFFIVQIFTWAGIFCIWLYFSLALAQHIFGLPPDVNISTNTNYQAILQKSLIQSNICFGIYQVSSVLYLLILPKLIDRFSAPKIHAISLLIGAASLSAIIFVYNMWNIYFLMIGVGVLWGSLITVPYTIISADLPSSKMGTYMGIFNVTITVPQIICGLIIGLINKYIFFNHAIFCIFLAGIMISVAGFILLKQEGVNLFKHFKHWLIKVIRNLNIQKSLHESKIHY